jgi:hypothetical protein
MFRFRLLLVLSFAGLAAGCVDGPDPSAPAQPERAITLDGPSAQATPRFLRPAPNAPPLAKLSVSFWAVKGKSRDGRIYYRPRPGSTDSSEFLRFIVPSDGLLRRPNGRLFAKDDSVRITITVVDQTNLIANFQPSGLKFNSQDPAELRIWYAETNDDIDRDGDVDQGDQNIETTLRIWKRDSSTAPWVAQSSSVDVTAERVRARVITSFTNYAIAY